MPFGCPEEKLELLLTKIIKPLLTDLYSHQDRKLLLYLTVNEYEWFEQKYPEINMLIYDLCKKNQLELLSGSYYDVMLPLIPAHERSIQIEKTTNYLRKRFGKRPKGMWCCQQFFSPLLIPVMEMSSIEYSVISSYSQSQNQIITTKPFWMDEMGRSVVILPFDDRFTKEITDYDLNKSNEEKLYLSIQKICGQTKEICETIMINMDQILMLNKPNFIFDVIYESLGTKNCTVPEKYLSETEISRQDYFPMNLYGRDINLGKFNSINRMIIGDPLKNRIFRATNAFREYAKNIKKNSPQRVKLETELMKANSSAVFVNNEAYDPKIRMFANQPLSELEQILVQEQNLPFTMDLDGDRIPEQCVSSKFSVAYINSKGAVLSRLNIPKYHWDLALHNGDGIFADTFINTVTGKKTSLVNRKYELTPLDKNRQDFIANCSSLDLDKYILNIVKRFKFRQNALILEIDMENTGSSEANGFLYQTTLNLLLSDSCTIDNSFNGELNIFTVQDKSIPFSVSIATEDNTNAELKHIYQNVSDCLGDKPVYQYTQIVISKALSLKPLKEDHLSLALKIEKRKEKK